MSTPSPSDKEPLALNLFNEHDDDEDIFYKKNLQDLLDGTVSPSKAASDFDTWVTTSSHQRLTALLSRPFPYTLTVEEEKSGTNLRTISPNASGFIELVFPTIARLCSAFPPHHEGQDRIIGFLEALRALPEHRAPDGIPEEAGAEGHFITLWPFGGNWRALAEVFRREAEDFSYPYSDIETPGSEVQIRWRNFQSAIARLTTLNLIDCGFLCALGNIVPSSYNYPDFKTRKIGGPNRVGGDVIAGAQWILWPDEGAYVYQQCKKVEKIEGLRTMWSMERWNVWKEQFAFVTGDERFDTQARAVAKVVGRQMLALEKEDVERKED
ncbi:hypothetical protein B0J11DRAFT_534869 [Dendryphion nanum]|uniref:Uncharacterized protein n=1 Tax=Dendryphion nanum TaxID=256645 RepID=A0A9P9DIR3_9PLEO|nr:hypothetical protein B0J11DRAFT_534869 [Dendryphion nanum]